MPFQSQIARLLKPRAGIAKPQPKMHTNLKPRGVGLRPVKAPVTLPPPLQL